MTARPITPALIERCFVAWSALAAYLADGWRIVPCFSTGDGRYVEIWRPVTIKRQRSGRS